MSGLKQITTIDQSFQHVSMFMQFGVKVDTSQEIVAIFFLEIRQFTCMVFHQSVGLTLDVHHQVTYASMHHIIRMYTKFNSDRITQLCFIWIHSKHLQD